MLIPSLLHSRFLEKKGDKTRLVPKILPHIAKDPRYKKSVWFQKTLVKPNEFINKILPKKKTTSKKVEDITFKSMMEDATRKVGTHLNPFYSFSKIKNSYVVTINKYDKSITKILAREKDSPPKKLTDFYTNKLLKGFFENPRFHELLTDSHYIILPPVTKGKTSKNTLLGKTAKNLSDSINAWRKKQLEKINNEIEKTNKKRYPKKYQALHDLKARISHDIKVVTLGEKEFQIKKFPFHLRENYIQERFTEKYLNGDFNKFTDIAKAKYFLLDDSSTTGSTMKAVEETLKNLREGKKTPSYDKIAGTYVSENPIFYLHENNLRASKKIKK